MSFPIIRLFLYFSCFTVRWLFCFMFFFFFHVRERSDSYFFLTHWVAISYFGKIFLAYLPTYLLLFIPTYYSYHGGKTGDWTATTLALFYCVLWFCLCVFFFLLPIYLQLAGRGLGRAWLWELIPSCTFFFFLLLLLLLSLLHETSWTGPLSESSACCGSVDESLCTCFSSVCLFFFCCCCCCCLYLGLMSSRLVFFFFYIFFPSFIFFPT